MKTLSANGEQFKADRIVKTDTDIIGYNNDSFTPAWGFYGISDFSQYQLTDGETFDIDLSPEARLQALEEALLMIL